MQKCKQEEIRDSLRKITGYSYVSWLFKAFYLNYDVYNSLSHIDLRYILSEKKYIVINFTVKSIVFNRVQINCVQINVM